MSTDTCAICQECLDDEGEVHTLECSHGFHSKCLIGWLRRGLSCPCCRSNLTVEDDPIGYLGIRDRASYLRRVVARRKCIPKDLQRLVQRVRAAEDRLTQNRRTLRDWKRTHGHVLRTYERMRRSRFLDYSRLQSSLRVLGLYSSDAFPLPGVQVTTRSDDF